MTTSNLSLRAYNTVLETLRATGGSVIDEHTKRFIELKTVGKYEVRGKTYAVGLLENAQFSTNLLIAKDGQVYLSTMAIGANVDARGVSLQKACELYSDYDKGQLSCVELFPKKVEVDTEEFDRVVARLRDLHGFYVDGHDGRIKQLEWVGKFVRGNKAIAVSVHENTYFSLNELFLADNGNVTLSTSSTGGVAETKGVSVEEGCAAYEDIFGNTLSAVRLFEEEELV